ncbi:MAG: McrB family protein, partial [Bacteroidota bacterium]
MRGEEVPGNRHSYRDPWSSAIKNFDYYQNKELLMFTWKPIYQELAEKLMDYDHNRGELLSITREMLEKGLPVIDFKDKNAAGESVELMELDPFSFFAHFNRALKNENRISILQFLKERFNLSSPVPNDFHGIPVVNMQKAWFFSYSHSRDDEDIALLWRLAKACVEGGPEQIDASLFNRCLGIRQVGVSKLTIGLFWMNPEKYLALDTLMVEYLNQHNINVHRKNISSLTDYLSVVHNVSKYLSINYPQLSWEAYLLKSINIPSQDELNAGFKKVLSDMAERNHCSIEQVAAHLLEHGEENEITNRIKHLSEVRDILNRKRVDADELHQKLKQLWVSNAQSDAIRLNSFFKSDKSEHIIFELVNDIAELQESDRIESFIQEAKTAGYDSPKGGDTSGAAQFASVLMSAKNPEKYVDFRQNRWNNFFELITGKKGFIAGSSYSVNMLKAGIFASALASTPIFKEYFGTEHGSWKVAGLAWYFRNGLFNLSEFQEKSGPDNDGNNSKLPKSLNTILYGPPGTGKTWKLRTEYMDGFTDTTATLSQDEYAASIISNLAWWKVITMVMMDLKESRVSDIMAHPLMQARIKISSSANPRAAIWAHIQMHTKEECQNVKYTKRYEPLLFEKGDNSVWSIDLELAEEAVPELKDKLEEFNSFEPGKPTKVERYDFTTFHQSFSYEDFVEGIKPVMPVEDATEEVRDSLTYEVRPGVFKKIVQRALADPKNNYALFIDEINRGNVASIFGELITLIEEDKRQGADYELTATLPYSQTKFVVPKNLYIIGAMNTADRSVEALDTALRRRFTFIAVPPDPNILKNVKAEGLSVDLQKLLYTVNARIQKLLDKDHCIGHSYFLGVSSFEDLQIVFATKILPLLEEYFYGDPARIGMVLGEKFVSRNYESINWASGDWGQEEFDERNIY